MQSPTQGRRFDNHTKALHQMQDQQSYCPTRLQITRVGWRLAGLSLHDGGQQWLFWGTTTPRFILQSGAALILVALQPASHGLSPITKQFSNLGRRISLNHQQDKMGAFRNSALGLAGGLMQFSFVSIIESNPEQLVLLVWCSDLPSLPNCSGLLFRLEKYGKFLHTYLVHRKINCPNILTKSAIW
jgi:hypothetical protein